MTIRAADTPTAPRSAAGNYTGTTSPAGGATDPLPGEGPSGAGVSVSPCTSPALATASGAFLERVRELAIAGHTRAGIAQAMRLTEMQLHGRLQRMGYSVTKLGVKPKAPPRRVAQPKAPTPATTDADRLKRNPFLTPLQQQQVDRHKARMWGHNPKLARLPPVTDDEAARLVADHIARRGVTQCPPAAEREIPNNAGAPWR